METQAKRSPKRKEDRIILHFDYDCFYAQVHENKNPALKTLPLGIRQKNILATCNYNARSRGVKKLMLASEAKKICPELVLVDGEDLTLFRDTSKTLFGFFRSYSWNGKVERLGFDEVFMDVTDIIDYNMFCLNRNSLDASFVYLSQKDPQVGFECDLSSFAGCVVGADCGEPDLENPTYLRLLLASHLARYLRLRVENDFGYTSTCGISPNKLLSKLAGTRNKPRNQTALVAFTDQAVLGFMDNHTLRTIPGLGFKTAHLLESHITSQDVNVDSHSFVSTVTARDVRLHPSVNPGFLETCLGGPGAEKGVGARVWHILHGIDPTEVKEASDVPSQISIEDTYKGLETMAQITEQLHKLSRSLLRRMRVDLLVHDDAADDPDARKWMASPKTIRLSIRSWPQDRTNQNMNYSRVSRSAPLPSFVFDIKADVDQLAERLVSEALLPLLRRLQSERGPKWNLQLINICVANMVTGANGAKVGAGRDIAVMFKQQDEVLRPWKVTEESDHEQKEVQSEVQPEVPMEESDFEDEPEWNGGNNPTCPVCDQHIPSFALAAHLRYHELGG